MKHTSLAARYRPQSFAEVVGQDMIKEVLSRASAEDRVASGYLFCGTRGVGKTTIENLRQGAQLRPRPRGRTVQ